MELVSRCCWQPRPPLSARLSPDMASSRDSVQSDSFPQSPQPSASPEMETEWSVRIIVIALVTISRGQKHPSGGRGLKSSLLPYPYIGERNIKE